MEYIKSNASHQDFNKTLELYLKAFPKDERVPNQLFIDSIDKTCELIQFYDQDNYVGFAYVVLYEDLAYLNFFAMDESSRNKGYGSKALHILQELYPTTLMLAIEEVNQKYEDYEMRKRRQEFYFRNRMKDMKFKFNEGGVILEMLYYGKYLEPKIYDLLMDQFYPNYDKFRHFEDDEIGIVVDYC